MLQWTRSKRTSMCEPDDDSSNMGEQPIFTTKAHVFQIDPSTKKKWLPASTTAVNVSYYYDSTRNTYRIISVEGSKAVINSTITPNMTFTKTSQKFGQWTDGRANTVYGLGFTSELDLQKFVEKFKEVKELTRQAQSQHPNGGTNGADSPVHAPSTPDISSSPVNVPPVNNKSSLSSQNELNERRNSSTSSLSGNTSDSQLKYENDRLKIALAQSSANAKKWEVELQTLKNNNARLTTALQESTTNVEEWKKQLAMYKEESARMKKKMQELERGGSGNDQLQQQVQQLTDRVHQLETTNRHKEEEITDLTSKMQALQPFERQNKDLSERVKTLETEKEQMSKHVESLQEQVNSAKTQQTRERQQIRDINDQVSRKMSELSRLHDQMSSVLQH